MVPGSREYECFMPADIKNSDSMKKQEDLVIWHNYISDAKESRERHSSTLCRKLFDSLRKKMCVQPEPQIRSN